MDNQNNNASSFTHRQSVTQISAARRASLADSDQECLKRAAANEDYGHKGFFPGQCFTNRWTAQKAGIHNEDQRGIAIGSVALGVPRRRDVCAVVVGAEYNELDVDTGDIIQYAETGAKMVHEGKQDQINNSIHADALKESLRRYRKAQDHPVRVLRSAMSEPQPGEAKWSPPKGKLLRYDGLYRVTNRETVMVPRGGYYDRYILTRMEEQPTLEECVRICKENLYQQSSTADDANVGANE